ncbi:MAG: hypothetical protein NC912_06615 [Candidatus Omnitrophica bacterium]|nr:hypothetical protein [Candidatus Omnitrophota bacterium]
MARINLLPAEFRRIQKQPTLSVSKIPKIIFSLGIIFLVVGISLRISTLFQRKSLNRIIEEYKNTQELNKKLVSIKLELNNLEEEINFLNNYLKRDINWSEKLSQLRDIIPEEVWLTYLSFEKKSLGTASFKTLLLKGKLIIQEKVSPVSALSIFVNKLKQDPSFFANFENLTLVDFHTETYKNIEVMSFFIELPVKKP